MKKQFTILMTMVFYLNLKKRLITTIAMMLRNENKVYIGLKFIYSSISICMAIPNGRYNLNNSTMSLKTI
jgi:hypothetical protein